MSSMDVIHGDSLAVLAVFGEDNYFDAVVTDPPYGLKFMGRKWDYDVPSVDLWQQVLRVLKPGGHVLSFGGTRTYHRMVVNLEDAGFEIRDQVMWLYGSGFPKSLNVGKAIDTQLEGKAANRGRGERETLIAMGAGLKNRCLACGKPFFSGNPCQCPKPDCTTAQGKEWQGWGTALKPAVEPIVLARKPLSEPTVAENVLRWGTGGLYVDGARVETTDNLNGGDDWGAHNGMRRNQGLEYKQPTGRFPANIILDEQAATQVDSQSGTVGGGFGTENRADGQGRYGKFSGATKGKIVGYGDSGGASRFFYCAKASKHDRRDSKHPTVKPISLIRYLIRLVTPPGGTVLDPFAGTGTTGEAAVLEGFDAFLIEREEEYIRDIEIRRAALQLTA